MLFMKAARQIKGIFEDGREVYVIPLGRYGHKGHCWIYKEDFDLLISFGVSEAWNFQNKQVTVPSAKAGGSVPIARLLLDAKPGQVVKFKDYNGRNLRGDNLELIPGRSTRRDRELLTPQKRQRARLVRP
jgi:hypothetical protein